MSKIARALLTAADGPPDEAARVLVSTLVKVAVGDLEKLVSSKKLYTLENVAAETDVDRVKIAVMADATDTGQDRTGINIGIAFTKESNNNPLTVAGPRPLSWALQP